MGNHAPAQPCATTSWRDRAACRHADPELFFAPDDETEQARAAREAAAKAVCSDCPVVSDCGDFALGRRAKTGIWGALTERERENLLRRIRRARRRQATA
jgi:WhiB family redox-sensing transcriptional regulator